MMSQGPTEKASATEGASASMEQMAASIRQVVGTGRQMETLPRPCARAAENNEVMAPARRGVFPSAQPGPVPLPPRQGDLRRDVDGRDGRHMVPERRAASGCAPLNLIDGLHPMGAPTHLIFYRDVLLYLERATQVAGMRRRADWIAPGRLRFLGHSEPIAGPVLARV
ncbi:CheR family methyltransferase [Sphingomonas sp. BK580]|uniref:CheR family methyltransferase n=1 Tax=Sphingomonas sp. BK580 TaxID=2586972 RepID=UPI001C85B45E|nr:CheR family methyltransferase [Sphingomonas sp. BK580]